MRRERDNKKTLNEKRRKLSNADFTIRSNSPGLVLLKSNARGNNILKIEDYDSLTVDYDDMQSIAKNHKRMFETFLVYIEDVYCPDAPEISVDDVEEILGLSRFKKGLDEVPNDYLFDDLLLDASFEEFREEVNKFKRPIIERLMERASYLFLNDEFADSYKMSFLEDKLGVKYMFEDLRRTKKEFKGDVDIF